jgi:hypothetical protein
MKRRKETVIYILSSSILWCRTISLFLHPSCISLPSEEVGQPLIHIKNKLLSGFSQEKTCVEGKKKVTSRFYDFEEKFSCTLYYPSPLPSPSSYFIISYLCLIHQSLSQTHKVCSVNERRYTWHWQNKMELMRWGFSFEQRPNTLKSEPKRIIVSHEMKWIKANGRDTESNKI